ncbi:2OG-Fe dioxygenase family protein [Campylobacter upsaliensis]|uniref:2OG-Fe dioxygenase family protein n=1 Tax=Campylobacter upsaliensis TaxID=28080 RepID=UPI00214A7978|nr:2OG-Fe dioxygenase family protein [Campylobacter upsaliensis]MCR2089001.1 2OG-Fe dioxygenase family protein [Campylobacter upsaliensis]MCR2094170.1 2OG-Fe dioxygenase family protein [Campylobacter upsaliensis]MCR2095974.1 2OG-Fe dioxygenase family protein [Campylobacter upsaliensis]MCR2107058.1 2OG-Fe dioxygenase family protein [Campylobacter upsaliensis]MCR2117952.1 2OG-Fe dioxygenase family protein [Campylobacter upsaliensis]
MFCQDFVGATNSPEGIHQDGMDFIMSAFVVERKNIRGAKSIIYMEDKKTRIFETILKDGQGILQVDANSPLW